MTEAKHTPGPWKRGSCDSYIIWAPRFRSTDWGMEGPGPEDEKVSVANVDCPPFARVQSWPDEHDNWMAECEANARLIAAAPDMLDALNKIVEMNVQYAIDRYGDASEAESMACVYVARAAIAKATGVK